MSRTSRKPFTLSESLQRHLNAYALAASAAGVGMLALAPPAEAKIVYTKTHKVVRGEHGSHRFLYLDLNHDGQNDFKFYILAASDGSGLRVDNPYTSRKSAPNRIWTSKSNNAAALPAGVRIGPGGNSQPSAFMEGFTSRGSGPTYGGKWINVKNRYLGLSFVVKGKTHYGWARLSASCPPTRGILTGYAYETIPNKPIITGNTKGPDVVTINSGSLGALAAGASRLHGAR